MTYKIVKQEWTPEGMDCEHALCDPLHKPYHKRSAHGLGWYCDKPQAPRVEWLIEDTETGEPIEIDGVLSYELKRDATKALKYLV